MTKSERHKALCNILNEIYKKNQAYGDSFHNTFVEEGLVMARIHLSDKLNRFKTLSRNPNIDNADESLTDKLLDLANYALMTILEIREATGADKPDEPEKPYCVTAEIFKAMNNIGSQKNVTDPYIKEEEEMQKELELLKNQPPIIQRAYSETIKQLEKQIEAERT